MLASTNVFNAELEPPGPAGMLAVAGSGSRVSETPPTVSVTDALPVTLPALGDVNVTVHVPLLVPGFVQVLVLIWLAAPFESVKVTVGFVPFGALTNPLPLPFDCFTVTVNVCGWPTSFVAVGEIAMLASTNVFTAGPVPPGPAGMLTVAGSVSRVNVTPPTVRVTDALAVTDPEFGDVNVTVQVPELVPGLAHVSVETWLAAPLASVS